MSTDCAHPNAARRAWKRVAIVASALALSARPAPGADQPAPTTGELSAYAAIGFAIGEKVYLRELQWNEVQFAAFVAGLRQSFEGGSAITVDAVAQPIYAAINETIERAQARPPVPPASDPLQLLIRQLGLVPTDRGVFARILRGGSGARPAPGDTVIVSISARTADSGEDVPALTADNLRIKVTDLIPGLAYGVQLLALDGHALLLVPPELSFSQQAWPAGVPRGSPLFFILRLHDVIAAEPGMAP